MARRSIRFTRSGALALAWLAGCAGSPAGLAAPAAGVTGSAGMARAEQPAGATATPGPGAGSAATAPNGAGAASAASGRPTTSGSGASPSSSGAATSGSGASPSGSGAALSGAGAAAATSGSGAAGSGSPGGGGWRCPPGPFGAPVPAGASAVRVDGFPPLDAFNANGNTRTNLEGPVWIGDKLYVSEFPFLPTPEARILAFEPASNKSSVALARSGSNGMAVDAGGALIATDHLLGAIVRMPFPLGTPEVLVSSYEGKRFDSPNDLAVRSDGNLYFSDPDYQAPSTKPQAKTRVYRLAPGASMVSVIDETRSQPNGVTLSADERTLYVAGSDGIFAYPVLDGGDIKPGSGMRLNGFNGSSDGLGMDCAGNLYATSGQRVVVLDTRGMELAQVAVPGSESVTNVAFGGAEHKTLFVTSMGSGMQRGLYRVELAVPGLPY